MFNDDDQKADARMEEIISAIKERDRKALRSLFSQKALGEVENFDDDMDFLFDFVKGNIISWERDDGISSDETISYGKRSLMIRSLYEVITNTEEYYFFVVDYNVDTINPDNAGVYMLEVMTSEGNDNLDSWQERLYAGIHQPKK